MIELALPLTSTGTTALGALSLIQHRRLHAARHDPLTGLAARRLWMSRAERATRRPQGLVLLIVDGDGLKQINDQFGHEAGDVLLIAIARCLHAWAGRRGMAGRLGGDEFAVFVRLAADEPLTDRLDALRAGLSAPVLHHADMLRAGASIGAVVVDTLTVPTLSQAMRAADAAMYQAKQGGDGAWIVADGRGQPVPAAIAPVSDSGRKVRG